MVLQKFGGYVGGRIKMDPSATNRTKLKMTLASAGADICGGINGTSQEKEFEKLKLKP